MSRSFNLHIGKNSYPRWKNKDKSMERLDISPKINDAIVVNQRSTPINHEIQQNHDKENKNLLII